MCLKCRYRFLNNFRTSDMKVPMEYSNCLSQTPQRVFITHGDNTLHLLDFSDKAACITTAGSRRSRGGEDPTQRHQRALVRGTKTNPREKHQDLHSHKQSLSTPANRKVLDTLTQGRRQAFRLSQGISQQLQLKQVFAILEETADWLFPSLGRLCYSSELGKFNGASRMTSAYR